MFPREVAVLIAIVSARDSGRKLLSRPVDAVGEYIGYLCDSLVEHGYLKRDGGVPPFLVPPTMRESLPLPLIVQPLLLDSFRSIFWQTQPEPGNPASCAAGNYCTPASRFPQ